MQAPADHVTRDYVGRFAPTPSGPLHEGSLVTAMASYLDARAHHGQWLLRIEDIDALRVEPDADRTIIGQLQTLGMSWDAEPVWQSSRQALYQATFEQLVSDCIAYGCVCTRQQYAHRAYPGTCRRGLEPGRTPRTWRFKVDQGIVHFEDRWLGHQRQDVFKSVGDFIIKRADGLWAYQFSVVIDDGAQGITDIVRGADLLSSTARQQLLAHALGLPVPRVLHVPLVLDRHGHKLSKQTHALPLSCQEPLTVLNKAWSRLGFEPLPKHADISTFWQLAIERWATRLNI